MTTENTSDTAKEKEKADVEKTEETEVETETEETEETEEETTEHLDKDERDYDAEIEEERKAGKPDPDKAKEAFKKREKKRNEQDEDDDKTEDEDDDNRPLTRKDIAEIEARALARENAKHALEIAKSLAGSDKEAELIVAKWSNRTFPPNLPLADQIREAYVITHSKRLIGERNEALRGLKNSKTVLKDGTGSHREGVKPLKPKMRAADENAIVASGYVLNPTSNKYEKKLSSGDVLQYDPKTGANNLIHKSK